jgi:hypothetical protein
MGDDRAKSHELQIVQRVVHRWGNRVLAELHQKIVFLVDAEARRIHAQGFDIFEVDVEVAPGGQLQALAEEPLKLLVQLPHPRVVKGVLTAGVRGAHDVGDALVDRGLGHRQGCLHVLGAVIQARQNMAMNIHHKPLL